MAVLDLGHKRAILSDAKHPTPAWPGAVSGRWCSREWLPADAPSQDAHAGATVALGVPYAKRQGAGL